MLFRESISFRRKKQFAELLRFIISPISIRSDMSLSKTVVDSLVLNVEVEVVERVRNPEHTLTLYAHGK